MPLRLLLAAVLFVSRWALADCEPHSKVGSVDVLRCGEFLVFESGLMIDADGAPNAYHPEDKGLDALANAGKPGNWWGVVTDDGTAKGAPVVQQASDPFPGYFVSATSLEDRSFQRTDPRRYVSSTAIPYIVLPPQLLKVARLGDLAVVERNGVKVFALVADTGPRDKLGEGSIALADALGVRSSPRKGGASSGVRYAILPKSGTGKPMTRDELDREGARALGAFSVSAEALARARRSQ